MPQDEFTAHLDAFLERVRPHWPQETFDSYRQRFDDLVHTAGVNSYEVYYAVLRDTSIDEAIRLTAFDLVMHLPKVDKRRAVGPLLAVLKNQTNARGLWRAAVIGLGWMKSKRALPMLLNIALDRSESRDVRRAVIYGLKMYWGANARIIGERLLPVVADKSEDPYVRGEIIDGMSDDFGEDDLKVLIDCLSDESAEVRFWACFGIITIRYSTDIRAVLPILDHIAATDEGYGDHFWAVRREVLAPLEYSSYAIRTDCQPSDDRSCDVRMYLISPLLEYFDFGQASRHEENGEWVWIPLEQSTDLNIDPAWLAERITARWPDARINVREPKLQSLLLDWEIGTDDALMLGGLQIDGYAITLTGDEDKIVESAIGLREIIPAQHTLYIYGWADSGREITPDIATWLYQPIQDWYKPKG